MNSARRAVSAAGVVLVVSALAACGTTVRINGAEVDSKVPFLSVLEQAWRDGPATDEYARLADKTSCWLLRDPDSGALQPRALCGPVRHLRDAGKAGVFDEVSFAPQLIGDDEVSVDPASVEFGASGVEPPQDLELYNPDSEDPVAPDQVPTPATPKAEPGIVVEGDPDLIADAASPKNGFITVPGRKITVSRFATVPRITAEGDAPFYVPADNEEFLALTITIEPKVVDQGSVNVAATYSLRSQGKTTDLAPYIDLDGGGFGREKTDTVTMVVSVPKGQDAELVVGVAGLDQVISARTGERTSTTAATSYRDETEFAVNKQFPNQRVKDGEFDYQHSVTFTQATLSAFHPDQGWAAQGQMWLSLAWDNKTSTVSGNSYDSPKFDQARSMQITGDAGKPAKIISGSPVSNDSSSSDQAVLTQIPETTKAVKITYEPHGTFSALSLFKDVEDLQPKTGSFTLKPLTFDVTFS